MSNGLTPTPSKIRWQGPVNMSFDISFFRLNQAKVYDLYELKPKNYNFSINREINFCCFLGTFYVFILHSGRDQTVLHRK